jgi:hypothetical protein
MKFCILSEIVSRIILKHKAQRNFLLIFVSNSRCVTIQSKHVWTCTYCSCCILVFSQYRPSYWPSTVVLLPQVFCLRGLQTKPLYGFVLVPDVCGACLILLELHTFVSCYILSCHVVFYGSVFGSFFPCVRPSTKQEWMSDVGTAMSSYGHD